LPHARGQGRGRGGEGRIGDPYTGRRAALAALSARCLPDGHRAQAPAGRDRPLPVVLPEVRRAAARRELRGRRLSRRPSVESLQDLLRQRGIPHLQGMRQRDAETGLSNLRVKQLATNAPLTSPWRGEVDRLSEAKAVGWG